MKSLQSVSSGALHMAQTAFSRQGLILLSIAFGALLVVPGVNTPKVSAAACNPGTVCLYQHIDFGGGSFVGPDTVNACIAVTAYNNAASSIRTNLNTGSWVLFYDGSNCTGNYMGQGAHANLAWIGISMNDKVSSYKVLP